MLERLPSDPCVDVKATFDAALAAGVPRPVLAGILAKRALVEVYDEIKAGRGVNVETAGRLRLAAQEADAAKAEAGARLPAGDAGIVSDPETMRQFLLATVGPPVLVHHHGDALVEIAVSDPNRDHDINTARLFSVFSVDQIIEYAAAQNALGRNVYVALAWRKPGTAATRRTKADDVLGGHLLWADADTPQQVERLQETLGRLGIKPRAIVTTGTTPTRRLQVVIEADRFLLPDEIERLNKALVVAAGSDAVADAGRVMRLPGTLSFPNADKAERGYVIEQTTVRIAKGADMVTYDPGDLASRLTGALDGGLKVEAGGAGKLNLATRHGRSDEEIDAMLAESQTHGRWHNNMRDVVATLVGRGLSDAQVRARCGPFCQSGADDPDLDLLIAGARAKGFGARDSEGEAGGGTSRKSAGHTPRFTLIHWPDIRFDPDANRWLVEGLLPTEGLAVIYGPPKAYKTFVALDLALAVARGKPWAGRQVAGGPVVYVAAEGALGLRQRVEGYRKEHRLPGCYVPFFLIAARPNLGRADGDAATLIEAIRTQAGGVKPALIVIDTLARCLGGEDENGGGTQNFVNNAEMLAEAFDCLAIAVHHLGKNADAGMRGHSSLAGAVVAAWRVTKAADLAAKIEVEAAKDSQDGFALGLRLKPIAIEAGAMAEIMTLVVVEVADTGRSAEKPRRRRKPSAGQQALMSAFDDALTDYGREEHPLPDMPCVWVVELDHVRRAYDRRRGDDIEEDSKRRTFERLMRNAVNSEALFALEVGGRQIVWRIGE